MAANLAGLLFTVLESLVPQSLLVQADGAARRLALARWSQGTAMALLPVSLLVILGDFVAPGVLNGSQALLVLMLAYTVLSAGQSLIRGQATAAQDFGTFLYLMSADGVVRVAAAVAVGLLAPSATAFAIATCTGAAVGCSSAGCGRDRRGGSTAPASQSRPSEPWARQVGRPLVRPSSTTDWFRGSPHWAP